MAIHNGARLVVDSNGLSDWLKLGAGANKITILCSSWGSASVKLRISPDGVDANACIITDSVGGTEVSLTANTQLVLEGPGYVAIEVTSIGGNITFFTENLVTYTKNGV